MTRRAPMFATSFAGPVAFVVEAGGVARRARRPRRCLAALAATTVLASASMASSAGAAATASEACPDVVGADLTLTGDLTCILRVGAAGVTIDLGGHTLVGAVLSQWGRVTVRNGTVDGGGGFLPALLLLGPDNRIERVEVRNVTGFAVQPGPRTAITDSRFVDTGVGVDLYWGGAVTIEGSTFTGNGMGVNVALDSDSVIRNNHFIANERGIRIWDEERAGSSNTLVANNVFADNGTGVLLVARAAAGNTRLTNNVFRANTGPGLDVEVGCSAAEPLCRATAGAGTLIEGNRFVDNGGSGALFAHGVPEALAGVTVTRNTAVRSDALGFDAVGVVDGGANVARNNGDPRQCTGVAC